jgi:hypothetical protein
MAEPHVVSALMAKHGELAGEVQRCLRELQELDEQLGHLDAAIRLFATDYDLASVRPRQRRRGQRRFGQRECQRLVLKTLRDALEPLSDWRVEAAVAASEGVEAQSPARTGLEKTTLATPRRLTRRRDQTGRIQDPARAVIPLAWPFRKRAKTL